MNTNANVLIYFPSQATKQSLNNAESIVNAIKGVTKTRKVQRIANSFWVDYDPVQIGTQNMIAALQQQGLQGCLVGM